MPPVPLAPGRKPGQPLLSLSSRTRANRKNERMERRELLYTVVRAMSWCVRACLSASYQVQGLVAGSARSPVSVMMDWPASTARVTARLSEIEALIAQQTAKTRCDDFWVTAVLLAHQ